MVVAVSAGVAPAGAKAKTPCWKTLINDWYDGRIDGTYAIHCYRDALKHLPTDVETYSSARDDIKQALQKRITQRHSGGTTTTGGSSAGGGSAGGGSAGGGSAGGGSAGGGSAGGGSKGGGSGPSGPSGGPGAGGGSPAGGPIGDALNLGRPAKADSLPIPLLVLGGVALLLMAAGGVGFLTRRTRLRRMQLAALPGRPGAHGREQS